MMIIHLSPGELVRYVSMLMRVPEQRKEFFERLGKMANPLDVVTIVDEMTPIQKDEFARRTTAIVTRQFLPTLVEHALAIVANNPGLSDEEKRKQLTAEVTKRMEEMAEAWAKLEVEKYKAGRNPKPRKVDRNDEIVRLRDVDGKTFGEIGPALIRINPQWCSKSGKPLSRAAVEKAYHRRKGMPTN